MDASGVTGTGGIGTHLVGYRRELWIDRQVSQCTEYMYHLR
jgi:hypothetical protein